MGFAPAANPVTFATPPGGTPAAADFRWGEFYQKALTWTNTSAARFEGVDISTDGNPGPEETRWVFLPKTPEWFSHDTDGNLLSDGKWLYTWDGENRLIAMETSASLPAAMPPVRLEFVYDYMSRRCVKRLFDKSGEGAAAVAGSAVVEGSAAAVVQSDEEPVAPESGGGVVIPIGWTLTSTFKYVWDGWNLLAELDGEDGVLRTCAWGLDLSGSELGAGGVGGLVFQYLSKPDTTYHPFYDGNGNVTSLRDDGGTLSCEYVYGPFGETLTARGDDAALAYNAFKFSTKYTDAESGLLYYGYRYYNPGTGRWLSRDPVAEAGGINLFGFVNNATSGSFDPLGLWTRDSWTGSRGSYTGTATAECDDDLGTLAYLITGVRSDRYELSIRSVKTGDIVDISPLLKMLERRLRHNVVVATNKFSTSGATFGLATKRPETEAQINAWFRGSAATAPTDPIDCKFAAMMVLTEGLILTLQSGEFDEYFGGKGTGVFGTPLRRDSVTGLQDTRNGDWFWFSNSAEYADLAPGGAWARENVIKVGADRFYGFPGGRHSEGEWKQKLLDQLNSVRKGAGKPPADLSAIPGFDQGNVTFIDVAKVGMKTFDERKKKQ